MKASVQVLGMALASVITFSMVGNSFAHEKHTHTSSQVGYSYKWVLLPKNVWACGSANIKNAPTMNTPSGPIKKPRGKCTTKSTMSKLGVAYRLVFNPPSTNTVGFVGPGMNSGMLVPLMESVAKQTVKKYVAYPANKCKWQVLGKKTTGIKPSLSSPTFLKGAKSTVYKVTCIGN